MEHSWKKDITVVIPVCMPNFVLPEPYKQVQVLLLSNGEGPLYIPHAHVLRVPWRGHAQTRKEALAYIQTKYVFFTVQDAFPTPHMLSMLHHEMEKNEWDILLARQVPFSSSSAVVRARIQRWMPSTPAIYSFPQADHVGALYRDEDLCQWALPQVPIAEDLWWSRGRRVACVSKAILYHAHERDPMLVYQREKAIHRQLKALQLIDRPAFRGVLSRRKGKERWADVMEQIGRWVAWLS